MAGAGAAFCLSDLRACETFRLTFAVPGLPSLTLLGGFGGESPSRITVTILFLGNLYGVPARLHGQPFGTIELIALLPYFPPPAQTFKRLLEPV
jgi:hypothetical protein